MVNQAQKPRPQVFINFRGAELREKFVNHLVWALEQAGINAFIDNHEVKGTKLDNLFNRIEQSTIAIAILSERYAESKWCLEELVKMNKLMEQKKLAVIPIFYKVSTDDVKGKAHGNFTIHFNQTKQEYAEQPDMVENWEHSLASMTQRIGFSSSSYGNDFLLVSAIVKEVERQLHMPIDSNLSHGQVAFLALFAYIVFIFIIASMARVGPGSSRAKYSSRPPNYFGPRIIYFHGVKSFQTPEWFLSFLAIVVVWRLVYVKWCKP